MLRIWSRRGGRRCASVLAVVATVLGAVLVAPSAAVALVVGPAGTLTSYPVACDEEPADPYEDSVCAPGPRGLAVAADGAIWITHAWAGPFPDAPPSIVRLDPADGTIERFEDPALDEPSDLVAAPDGSMWFANEWSIGHVTAVGDVTVHHIPYGDGFIGARQVAMAPDGAVWFIGRYRKDGGPLRWGLGRFDPTTGDSLVVAEPEIGEPHDVIAGPDGAMWFTMGPDQQGRTVGRVTATADVTTFATPWSSSGSLAVGPDAALWISVTVPGDPVRSGIGRLTTDGAASEVGSFDVGSFPSGNLVTGTDGRVWFQQLTRLDNGNLAASLANMDPSGAVVTTTEVAGEPAYDVSPDGGLWIATNTSGARSIDRYELHGAPGAPTAATVRPARTWATVAWEPPAFVGDDPVVSYEVAVEPGGHACTRSADQLRSCTFVGLTPGIERTFTVTATSASGAGTPAVATELAAAGSTYHDVAATRLLDSRTANGGWNGPLVAGADRDLQVTGRAGIPATATAAVINVTVTDVTAPTYLSVFPAGTPRPLASSVNVVPGGTRPNLVTVPLGTGGRVSFADAVGSVHVVADVVGYYDDGPDAGLLFNALPTERVLDTRVPGTYAGGEPLSAGDEIHLPVMALAGFDPSDAEAVVVNITATGATHDTFVTAWNPDDPTPTTSSVNVRAGETVANLAVVGADADVGAINLATAVGSVEVIVDVVGYFSADGGDHFHPITPARVRDSRTDAGGTDDAWGPGTAKMVPVIRSGSAEITTDATAVVANLTVTDTSSETFALAYPPAWTVPLPASTVNLAPGQTLANATYVGVLAGFQYQGQEHSFAVYNHLGSAEVVVDVTGYFAPF